MKASKLVIAVVVLGLCGLADASYLTVQHFANQPAFCVVGHSCGTVLDSAFSTLGPVPLAALGVLYYALTSGMAFAMLHGAKFQTALMLVTTMGFLVSLLLMALQLFVLHAICPWCCLSAALSVMQYGIALRLYNRQAAGSVPRSC